MSKSSFRDSPAKRMVRENWNTPLLRYLHDKYGIRYRYMGFPGTDLTDIKLWQDMIESIVAFELRAPGPDERSWVKELRTNLRKLGIPAVAYFGSFEQVVTLREDFDGQSYRQDKVITLYNLDFCDEISSQVETRELGKRLLRFEALRLILLDQKACYRSVGGPTHFIMLLTCRNQTAANRINGFLKQNPFSETDAYCSICRQVKPIPSNGQLIGTHAWALKAFIYNSLKGYFSTPNISALFFPFVKYKGTPIKLSSEKKLWSPMLHWMILCKFEKPEKASPVFLPNNFLDHVPSLAADKSGITIQPEPGERNNSGKVISSIQWFEMFKDTFF